MSAVPNTGSANRTPGCGSAILVSIAIFGMIAGCAVLLGGDLASFSEEWPILILWYCMIAAPFGVLAIRGIDDAVAWSTAISLTLVFWGGLFYSAFESAADQSGVNIGYALLMLASPVIIIAISLIVAKERNGA